MEIWGSLRSFGAKTGGFGGVKMGYFGGSSQFWGACVAFCCLQHFGVNSEDFGVPRRFGVNLPDFGVRPFGAESPKISPSFGSPTILGILQYFGVKVGDFGVLRNFGVDFEGFGVPQHSGVNSGDLGGIPNILGAYLQDFRVPQQFGVNPWDFGVPPIFEGRTFKTAGRAQILGSIKRIWGPP